ncbi:Response regulator receiver domain-containing protein [Cnuella takakiae]|uniref:Response regulator receiver domain-containing protein n=1 Tax=Cnuella takakiae TaxID=1302690 RepID=A0A1M4S7U2_9BACT|nr:response regulator [Cnuella takakiae]OLY94405.1 hypothetical protein BUE76_22880 [Cnuella takakiae]SHE28276.1 Response regulator receiver domain-containing protein [Cnuella takakiae]
MKRFQVYWVDDEKEEREIIQQIFEEQIKEIELVLFDDGSILLDQLRDQSFIDQHPSLIVTDLNMPGLDGREVMRQIASESDMRHIPMVIFSSSNNRLDSFYLTFFKATRYVKPTNASEYKEVINKILEKHLCNEADV